MAVPSSGQLRLRADIALEVDGDATGSNVSLGTLADSAGFDTPPDTMQEFYGYSSVTAPSVTTSPASSVTASSMQLNGNVTSENGASVTDRGFYFGTDSNYANNTKTSVGSGVGTYNLSQTSLTHSTTYYITSFAVNSAGEGVGSTIGQATSVAAAPSVTSNPSFSSVGVTSMTTSAGFSNPDNLNVTYKVYFGTSSNYSSNTLYTIETSSGNPRTPSKNFTGLNASTTYYARFVAQASGYSDVQTTTTSQATPALATYQTTSGAWFDTYPPAVYNSAWAGVGHYFDIRQQLQYNHANYGYTNIFYYRTYTTNYQGSWSGQTSQTGSQNYNLYYRTDVGGTTTRNRTYFYHYTSRQQFTATNYFYTGNNMIYRTRQQSIPSVIRGVQLSTNGGTQSNQTCGSTIEFRASGSYNLKGMNCYSCSANHNAVFGASWQSWFDCP